MLKRKQLIASILMLALAASPAALFSGCKGGTTDLNSNPTSTTASTADTTPVNVDFGLKEKIEDGVILHAWSWSFNTIKESMADIAAAGYSTIQTSPANEVIVGGDGGMQLMGKGKWYFQYQPTDWKIGNYQVGTEEDFKAMCQEADRYGIKIIVDVVPNHTSADKSAVSENLINSVGGADKLYHKNESKNISSYADRLQCTTYSLSGLHDVNTENPAFQEYFIKYLNQLIADGADGFRYDTAKHIGLPDDPKEDDSYENNFWEQVTTKIDKADSIFNYGEVLQGDNERIADYVTAIGHTTASGYGAVIRSSLKTGRFKAKDMSDMLLKGSTKGVTWVESHDNYTGDGTYSITDEQIIRGWAVIAANGDGTPLFFDRPYGSSPDSQWGTMNRIGAAGSDIYKDSTVVALNRFRNAMAGEATEMTNPDEEAKEKLLLICRGTKGAVIVNGSDKATVLNIKSTLGDGTYTDRTGKNGDFTVTGGTISGSVAAGGVAVLYNDGYTDPVVMPKITIDNTLFNCGGDTVSVNAHVKDAQESTYSVNGGAATNFADGESINVALSGETTTLTLSAKGSNGLTSNMTYYFNKVETTSKGTEIKFDKPSSWGEDVYIYIYDETKSPVETNDEWPGKKMTKGEGSTYTYALEQDWSAALVIFSDGNNQYPAAMEPGASLEAGKIYKADDNAPAVGIYATISFIKPDSWGDNLNAYVYSMGGNANNGDWPGQPMTSNGDGTYSYKVPDTIPNPVVIFNDGKKQYPTTDGLEVVDGQTYKLNWS